MLQWFSDVIGLWTVISNAVLLYLRYRSSCHETDCLSSSRSCRRSWSSWGHNSMLVKNTWGTILTCPSLSWFLVGQALHGDYCLHWRCERVASYTRKAEGYRIKVSLRRPEICHFLRLSVRVTRVIHYRSSASSLSQIPFCQIRVSLTKKIGNLIELVEA